MIKELINNAPLVSAALAFCIAQALKPFIKMATGHPFEIRMFWTNGGMPSSHTATVLALATSIGCTHGVGSTPFALSIILSFIVINDALNIRRQSGKQAEVINEWSKLLSEIHKNGRFTEEHLMTMLGHSFAQVAVGFVLGVAVGLVVTWHINPW